MIKVVVEERVIVLDLLDFIDTNWRIYDISILPEIVTN